MPLPDRSESERWMRHAFDEAERAMEEREVPVGCVIVLDGRLIGRGHNRVEALKDPTAHAEILALTAATSTVGSWRLPGAQVYVTVEPCLMCVGALLLARTEAICFGAWEPKFGACGSIIDAPAIPGWNHTMRVTGGILESDCSGLMRRFFRMRRSAIDAGEGDPL